MVGMELGFGAGLPLTVTKPGDSAPSIWGGITSRCASAESGLFWPSFDTVFWRRGHFSQCAKVRSLSGHLFEKPL